MSMDRRTLLKSAAAASLAGPFAGLLASPVDAAKPSKPKYPLLPVADQRDEVIPTPPATGIQLPVVP